MSKPSPDSSPSTAELDSIEIPSGPKTFKLNHAVDRYLRSGEELPKGKTAKATEITLRPLRWGDLLDLPLRVSQVDTGALIDVAGEVAGEHRRTMDDLGLRDAGRLIDYVARSLVPLSRLLEGHEGDEPVEMHDGSAAVSIDLTTKKAAAAGEPLTSIEIPRLKAGHVRGFPLRVEAMSFRDARDMVGKATGYTDRTLDALEIADVGNLLVGLLGFLQELHAT